MPPAGSTASSQADSEVKSKGSGCVYDNTGKCAPGVSLPSIRSGKQTTQQAAFPNLTKSQWDKLQNSSAGRELIKQAEGLRARQAAAQTEYNNLKRTGTGAQLTAADNKIQAIGNQIQKLQPKAQQILVELR